MPDCDRCALDPDLKRGWGCEAPSTDGFRYDLGGEIIDRCPISLTKTPMIRPCYRAYAAYKHGITPNGRGMRFETAFFCEVMGQMEYLENEAQTWYASESERKARLHG